MSETPQAEMPKYKCHKIVHALKIDGAEPQADDGSIVLLPGEPGFVPFKVDRDFVQKHNPEPGGYYVVYEDGYVSFSPAKAFEDGYTRI